MTTSTLFPTVFTAADSSGYRFCPHRLSVTPGCCLIPANDVHKRRERKQLLSSSTRLRILLRVQAVIHVLHIATHSSGVQGAAAITALASAFVQRWLELHFFFKKLAIYKKPGSNTVQCIVQCFEKGNYHYPVNISYAENVLYFIK